MSIDDIATMWRTTRHAPLTRSCHGHWRTELAVDFLEPGEFCEVRRATLQDGEGQTLAIVELPATERALFEGRDPLGPERDQDAVRASVEALENDREERFSAPLEALGPGEREVFRVLMLVERLLLGSNLRVPGLELLPLNKGSTSRDEAHVINAVLRELGWGASVDPAWWGEQSSRERPIVLLRANRVIAIDHHAALVAAQDARDLVLDVLASQRRARGQPFGAVVQRLVDADSGTWADSRIYIEQRNYGGNLATGFISGEDPHALVARYRAVSQDMFARLVVQLFAEAQTERNEDFAYFRFWNLLEVVATARIPNEATQVTDFSGAGLTNASGQPITRANARGRVYDLVREYAQRRQWSEQIVSANGNLQDAVDSWYARRNLTAHSGGFDAQDPTQQGYGAALRTVEPSSSWSGHGRYLEALRSASELVESVELARV